MGAANGLASDQFLRCDLHTVWGGLLDNLQDMLKSENPEIGVKLTGKM